MVLSNKKRALTALLANIARLLLAAVLIVSGFVKAVDPMGLFYKLQEYMAAFGVDFLSDGWIQLAAMLLAAAEFIMGVLLLMGVYNRINTLLVFLFFLFFTPFTLVLALWNPVRDCGCFGDALHLSNWATFGKNLLLLVFATMACFKHRLFVRRISIGNRWMVTMFAICYVMLVEIVSTSFLPIIDFRPFAVGSDLRKAVVDIPSETKTIYRFEKNGEVAEFDDETYPDSTWNYLGSRTEVLKEGRPSLIADFAFLDMVDGDDYTLEILDDTTYVCMLIMNRIETADESRVDKINDLYDICVEQNIKFYAATSSEEESVELWRKRTGAEYPVLWADEVMLKTIIRANPGVLLIKNGVVVGKWNVTDLPSAEEINSAPTYMPDTAASIYRYTHNLKLWLLLFIIPITVIITIDVIAAAVRRGTKKQLTEENADTAQKTDK